MADVFISYKSEDREWAKKVDALIKSAGYTTWWDASLETGQRYNDRIDQELRAANAAIVLWSERSWASAWVKEEALFARDQDKLLPIRIDGVSIGVPFYSLHTVDFTDWDGDPQAKGARELIQTLTRRVPRDLSVADSVKVYWTRFNDGFVSDEKDVEMLFDRISAVCSSIGVRFTLAYAGDYILNSWKIGERAQYEKDLNIVVHFGGIKGSSGFIDDVIEPGLDKLQTRLQPFVIQVGDEDNLNILDFSCRPDRKVITQEHRIPDLSPMDGISLIDTIAHYIAFRVLRVRSMRQSAAPLE